MSGRDERERREVKEEWAGESGLEGITLRHLPSANLHLLWFWKRIQGKIHDTETSQRQGTSGQSTTFADSVSIFSSCSQFADLFLLGLFVLLRLLNTTLECSNSSLGLLIIRERFEMAPSVRSLCFWELLEERFFTLLLLSKTSIPLLKRIQFNLTKEMSLSRCQKDVVWIWKESHQESEPHGEFNSEKNSDMVEGINKCNVPRITTNSSLLVPSRTKLALKSISATT